MREWGLVPSLSCLAILMYNVHYFMPYQALVLNRQ